MESHNEFLELCAVSTSGELSEQERKKLEAHLAGCAECRQALKEFEAAVDVGVPFLASKLCAGHSELFAPAPTKPEQAASQASLLQTDANDAGQMRADVQRGFVFAQGNGHRRTQINWKYMWLPFAACILLTIALGISAYRIGRGRRVEVKQTTSHLADMQIEALEEQISDVGHEREELQSQLAERDKVISDLKREIQAQSASLYEMKNAQADLEQFKQKDEAEKQQSAQDRGTLLQKLDTAQASLQKAQAQLESLQGQRTQDESRADSLEAQVNDLHAQLREGEQTIGKQEDLLAHDRDVRELIGARDLYIAEIYNVGRRRSNAKTIRPRFLHQGKVADLLCLRSGSTGGNQERQHISGLGAARAGSAASLEPRDFL